MEYKITIIMPVYNGEDTLRNALDSIVNQTIGVNNLQVIIVDDKSTDGSREIIDDYCNVYPDNFHAVFLDENIGAAYGPKNVGLRHVKAPFLMFLDSDDSFENDACEVLYNKITDEDADIVYGRYKRIYSDINYLEKDYGSNHCQDSDSGLIQKSHSAFKDSLADYTDDIIDNIKLDGFIGFLWKNVFSRFFYGKTIENPDNDDGVFDEIYLNKLEDNTDILRSLPSFWTKIYKTSLILDNHISFPAVISAEDLNFLMNAYFHAEGIVFLNNKFVYNYYMRDSEDNKSITKHITYKLVYDSLIGYSMCSDLCNEYGFDDVEIIINPFLLNWISLYSKADLSDNEKAGLFSEFKIFSEKYNCGWKGKLLSGLILRMIKKSL